MYFSAESTTNCRGVHHSHLNHAWDHYTFSGKLPTYPSPKPTACPKWEVSDNVDLGEGWVVSLRLGVLAQTWE